MTMIFDILVAFVGRDSAGPETTERCVVCGSEAGLSWIPERVNYLSGLW